MYSYFKKGEDWHFRKIIGWGFFNFTTNLLNDQGI
jgi:hypothetical protein